MFFLYTDKNNHIGFRLSPSEDPSEIETEISELVANYLSELQETYAHQNTPFFIESKFNEPLRFQIKPAAQPCEQHKKMLRKIIEFMMMLPFGFITDDNEDVVLSICCVAIDELYKRVDDSEVGEYLLTYAIPPLLGESAFVYAINRSIKTGKLFLPIPVGTFFMLYNYQDSYAEELLRKKDHYSEMFNKKVVLLCGASHCSVPMFVEVSEKTVFSKLQRWEERISQGYVDPIVTEEALKKDFGAKEEKMDKALASAFERFRKDDREDFKLTPEVNLDEVDAHKVEAYRCFFKGKAFCDTQPLDFFTPIVLKDKELASLLVYMLKGIEQGDDFIFLIQTVLWPYFEQANFAYTAIKMSTLIRKTIELSNNPQTLSQALLAEFFNA